MISRPIELFYLFFQGVLLFQVIFFAMIYYLFRKKELLYYSAMNLVTAFYFFLNAPFTFFGISEEKVFGSIYYDYTNFALILGMTYLYLIFIKTIFDDTLQDNVLRITYQITLFFYPFLLILFILCTELKISTNLVFFAGHLINGPFVTITLIKNINIKGYKRLINVGMIILFIFIILTAILSVRYNEGKKYTVFEYYPLFFIKIGMLIDIILFQLALLLNWQNQEKELLIEKMESQLIAERIRTKIASELHDDLGASLSGISMYSHLIKSQVEKSNSVVLNSANTIQTTADDMVNKLSDIVWITNPEKDSLPKLFEKLEDYLRKMASIKNIRVILDDNINGHIIPLPDTVRKNIYLLMKEAINNAVKYSDATEIKFTCVFEKNNLKMGIEDNGKGFDLNTGNGNGIQNMRNRAQAIQANLDLESGAKGSKVMVLLKI